MCEDDEIAVVEEEPEIISVQEMINRCVVQAHKFGVNSKTRLLLLNTARALAELTIRLDGALTALDAATKPLIITSEN